MYGKGFRIVWAVGKDRNSEMCMGKCVCTCKCEKQKGEKGDEVLE